MSGGDTKNAALVTALSFHYQVLIGLVKCFSLDAGQIICFEKDGDVSLLAPSPEQSTQTEVKDYSTPLTNHHENLWKTLKNWLDPEFNHSQYGSLVLHTTQSFGATTKFKNWNTQTAGERLEVLHEIFGERTQEELDADPLSNIVKLQKKVMDAESTLLMNILDKVTLFTEADDPQELVNNILINLHGIPENNQISYLENLVGFVYGQANEDSWNVSHGDFKAKCEDLTSQLCKKEFTFPPFTGYEPSDEEVETHQDKLFVQKIQDIEHLEVIPDAVGNWMELQNSLLEELDGYPLYAEKTTSYQKKLIKRFKLLYSSAQLRSEDALTKSKLLYNDTIAETPLNIGNDTPPIEYKNGLIHDAMDDDEQELKWRVEKP
jgi:hypothetical protein